MSTRPTQPDDDVEYFYFRPMLTIDPPLPDAAVKAFNTSGAASQFFGLKQKKDEDVKVVDGEIKVVTTNITAVEANAPPTQHTRGYPAFKAGVEKLCALVTASKSSIEGYVLVRRYDDNEEAEGGFFRLRPEGGKCIVEGSVIAWPDGTTLTVPDTGA